MKVDINENKIVISYQLGGQYFKNRGKYTSAKVSRKRGKEGNFEFVTDVRSKTLIEPEYEDASITLTLGKPFLEYCLPTEKPKRPNLKGKAWARWIKSREGRLWQDHNKLTDKQKINLHVERYVEDLTGDRGNLISYNII